MLRVVFLLIFTSFVFAQDVDIEFLKSIKPVSSNELLEKNSNQSAKTTDEILNKDTLTLDDLKQIAPNEDGNLELDDSLIYQEVRVTDFLLSTRNVPKNVYQNQIFSINFNADIQQNISLDLNLTVDKTPNLEWLNEGKINWDKDINGVYSTKLWFEAKETNASLNKISIIAKRNGEFFQKANISPKLPKIIPIEEKNGYAHIVADELKVLNYKTAKFDANSNIMTIELSSKNANLKSFHINSQDIIRQGINSTKGGYQNQRGFYFVVFNNNIKKFDFSYFNAKTKQFESFSLGIKLEVDDLSTQTELNPQNDPFYAYKKTALYVGVILLLFLYIFSKNTTPLIFACILIGFHIYNKDPHNVGIVSKDAKVKILPIEKSTIFYIPNSDESVEIFEQNKNYYKVLFENGKIGWVNSKYLIKK